MRVRTCSRSPRRSSSSSERCSDLLAEFVALILELLRSRPKFAARAVGRFQLILQRLEMLLHLRILVAQTTE